MITTCINKSALFKILFSVMFCALFLSSCSNEQSFLTPEERDWLKNHKNEIVLSSDPSWPTYEYINDKGELSGLSAAVMVEIEKKLGAKFKTYRPETWNELVERTKAGKIHIWNGASLTPQRQNYMFFSKPYAHVSTTIVVRSSDKDNYQLENMRNMKIGVTKEYAVHHYLINNYPYLNIIPVSKPAEGLIMVSDGRLDAMVISFGAVEYYNSIKPLSNLKIAGKTPYSYNLSIATTKNLPILHNIISKALDELNPQDFEQIKSEWWVKHSESESESFLNKYIIPAFVIFIVLISILIFILRRKNIVIRNIDSERIKNSFIKNKKTVILLLLFFLSVLIAAIYLTARKSPENILTSEEKNWLESREKPIRFTPCPDYPPLDFIDTNHEHSGLSYDYLKLIEKKIDYKFSIIEADSWSDLTEKYKTGKTDFVSSIHKNPEREKYLNFTDSYIKVKAVFITRKNFRQKFDSVEKRRPIKK